METKNEEWSDGKLALFHKEAVVQFILRSPLLLSSSVPPDYAEQLRRPYTPEELEEAMPQDSMPRLHSPLQQSWNVLRGDDGKDAEYS